MSQESADVGEDIRYARATRANYRSMIPLAGTPDPVSEVRAITIAAGAPSRYIPARLYVPKSEARAGARPIVLFFHGGGFVSGDLDTHDVLARALANGGDALVLSIEWRLAPEHPFPAGVDDAYAALEWTTSHIADLGGDPSRIGVSGDSVGGTIAAALALLARDRRGPKISALVLFYPVLDHALDTDSWRRYGQRYFPTRGISEQAARLYVPEGGAAALRNPLVSPLRGELHELPPTLVITGQFDPLKDEGRAFTEKLRASGVRAVVTEYEDAEHGFVQFFKDVRGHPRGEEALREATAFLREALDV